MKKVLIIVLILNFSIAFAQEDVEQYHDAKVGLVLSGGGAKGFAHVGVLKVLEEAGVRVDYIAGTSMGSIIGALYAAGYNANELDSILKVNDFSELLQDKLPRQASSFYQKENTAKYAISLPVKKWKVGFPSAISKGQNVFNLLSELTEHVHEIDDFSKLPIPFFCIATDLETGEELVLDHGFLPEAIRASGSFPGLLSPVKINGRLLVDGGIVDNYPIEKLKAKGVDIIIGVDVQGKLLDEEDLTTVPIILKQIAGFQMYKNIDEKIKMTDLYLKPDISAYNDFSFADKTEIVQKGEEISREHFAELKEIAGKQMKRRHHSTISTFDLKGDVTIKEIKITGNENYTYNYCIDKLKIVQGQTVSHDKFVNGINSLTATGNFESVNYRFSQADGGVNVEIKLVENEVSTFLQLGAHYDDLYKTGILVNFTVNHAWLKNDFLSVDFVFGDNLRYNLDYFIENGSNWSFGMNTRYNSFNEDIVINEIPSREATEFDFKVPVDYNDFTTRFYVQTTISNILGLRLGVEHKYLNIFTEEIVNNRVEKFNFDKSNYFNLFGKLTFDSYDTKYYPKKGFFLDTDYIVYLLSPNNLITEDFESFSQLFGRLGIAQTFFKKLTFHFISEAGITIGSNGSELHDYHLGGNNENFINTFIPFYGYDVAELNESAFLRSALTIRYEIFKNNFVSFTGNYARLNDDLWNGGDIFEDTRSGYAFEYGLNSIIGPLQLMYSWNPDNNKDYWRLSLGFWF